MKKIKFRTEFSNDFTGFVSNSGNGEKVPQYELNENNVVVPKLDVNGKQVFHNLKADIQKNVHCNDYIRLLNSGMDAKDIQLGTAGVYQDCTQAGSGVDVLNAKARLDATGMSYDQFIGILKDVIKKQQEKKVPEQKVDAKVPEQKKDEVKK